MFISGTHCETRMELRSSGRTSASLNTGNHGDTVPTMVSSTIATNTMAPMELGNHGNIENNSLQPVSCYHEPVMSTQLLGGAATSNTLRMRPQSAPAYGQGYQFNGFLPQTGHHSVPTVVPGGPDEIARLRQELDSLQRQVKYSTFNLGMAGSTQSPNTYTQLGFNNHHDNGVRDYYSNSQTGDRGYSSFPHYGPASQASYGQNPAAGYNARHHTASVGLPSIS